MLHITDGSGVYWASHGKTSHRCGGHNQNWTTNHGQHTERKTTSLAWTCLPYGPPAHTTASVVLAGTRIQERTRSTKSELEGRSQQRPTKEGVHLGGSRVGSSILTDTDGRDGVGVWPNVSSWTRAESRSRSRSRYHSALPVPFYDALQSSFYITLEAPDVEQARSVR